MYIHIYSLYFICPILSYIISLVKPLIIVHRTYSEKIYAKLLNELISIIKKIEMN